jgi:hypothetical protein
LVQGDEERYEVDERKPSLEDQAGKPIVVAAKVIQELLRWYSHLTFLGPVKIADVRFLAEEVRAADILRQE